jgi:D-amino-acid dehydrogenase
MKILVMGAGVVGMATAWWLAQDGHRVTVVDRALEPGQGTSFANGAQLSFSYVAPMAAPSVLRNLPKWLVSSSSPVRYVPSADPAQWQWVMRFLAACNAPTVARNTARLLALSFHSRDRLHEMMARTPVEFLHRPNGKLVVQSSVAAMRDAEAQLRLQAVMGCEQAALTAAECVALEPGLASIAHRLVGGIHTPSEEVGDCRMLCVELQRVLAAPPFSVDFRFGVEIRKIVIEAGRVRAVETSQGALEADLYVLAAGPGSRFLGAAAGVRVPVQPIRGYSITAPIRNSNAAPVRSITDTHVKTVYAPVGNTIRAAGFAEIAGAGTVVRPDRIAVLKHNVETTFQGACDLSEVTGWAGLRPSTPTDLPVIGASRVDNLLLNLGQGSLGFTLAAGSAALLADIVAGRSSPIATQPYAPV